MFNVCSFYGFYIDQYKFVDLWNGHVIALLGTNEHMLICP